MITTSPSKSLSDKRLIHLIILAALIGLFLFVFWLAMKSQRLLSDTAFLVVDAQYLSLGEIFEQKDFRWTFPIENRSAGEIHIKQFATGHKTLSVEPKSMSIPPGHTVNAALICDFTAAIPTTSLDGMQSFCLRIIPVLDNQVKSQPGWTFCGKVRRFLTFQFSSVQLWTGLYRGRESVHQTVDVLLHQPATNLIATSSSPLLLPNLTRQTPDRYRLDLTFSNQAPVGPFDHSVQFIIIDDRGHEKPVGRLRVNGEVKGEIEALPGQVSFGAVTIGTKVTQDVHLQPGNSQSISLVKIDNPCPDATVTVSDGNGNGVFFRITQDVKQAGQQSYVLTMHLESLGHKRHPTAVPVKVNYYGLPPTKE